MFFDSSLTFKCFSSLPWNKKTLDNCRRNLDNYDSKLSWYIQCTECNVQNKTAFYDSLLEADVLIYASSTKATIQLSVLIFFNLVHVVLQRDPYDVCKVDMRSTPCQVSWDVPLANISSQPILSYLWCGLELLMLITALGSPLSWLLSSENESLLWLQSQ